MNLVIHGTTGLEQIVEALNVRPITLQEAIDASATIPRNQTKSFRKANLSLRLRFYVDAWLQTGRRADGSDAPLERSLWKAQRAWGAVAEYVDQYPFAVDLPLGHDDFSVVVGRVPRNFSGDFLDSIDADARRLFTSLIASGQKETLCKCTFCDRYFLLKRMRRVPYKHGTFCGPAHQNHWSATIATRKVRAAAETRLIEFAAEQLRKRRSNRTKWQEDTKLKTEVAAKLSTLISVEGLHNYRQAVTENWVNRHSSQIEQKRLSLTAP